VTLGLWLVMLADVAAQTPYRWPSPEGMARSTWAFSDQRYAFKLQWNAYMYDVS